MKVKKSERKKGEGNMGRKKRKEEEKEKKIEYISRPYVILSMAQI